MKHFILMFSGLTFEKKSKYLQPGILYKEIIQISNYIFTNMSPQIEMVLNLRF